MIGSIQFDPSAVRVITVDWCKWPFPPGTRIATINWTVPKDFAVLNQSVVGTKANIKVRYKILGGTTTDYEFVCHMVTNQLVIPPDLPAQDTRRFGVEVIRRVIPR